MDKHKRSETLATVAAPRSLGRVEDAMRVLSASRATVYKLMDGGELEWVKIGRSRRVVMESVQELIGRKLVGGREGVRACS